MGPLETSKYNSLLRLPEQFAQGYVQVLRLLNLSGQQLTSLISLTEKDHFPQLRNSSSISPNIFAYHPQHLLALKKEVTGNCSIDDYSQWEPYLRHAAMLMCKQNIAKNPTFPRKSQRKKKVQKTNKQNKTESPKEKSRNIYPC